jgi:hypothetical protein
MYHDQALLLKQQLSHSFLGNRKSPGFAFSLSTGNVLAAAASATTGGSRSATVFPADLRSNINGVGVVEDQTGESKVKILTRNKAVDTSRIATHFGVPPKDVIIEKAGSIEFKSTTNNHRPPFPGISVGHYKITAGTLGCFVKDGQEKVYILSNNHVLANTDKGFYNDPILQPGKLDGGRKSKDVIAFLHSLVSLSRSRPNEMDAAIALLENGLEPDFNINQKARVSGLLAPSGNLKVEKFGRTTGHTEGSITTRNLDLEVDYDGQLIEFQDQFEIKGRIKGGKRTMFCNGGDSGSLILEKGSFKAVGLLFAGTKDGTTFATPINAVLNAFSVKIV